MQNRVYDVVTENRSTPEQGLIPASIISITAVHLCATPRPGLKNQGMPGRQKPRFAVLRRARLSLR